MEEDSNKQWRRLEKLRNPKLLKRRLRKAESVSLKHAHTFVVGRWSNVMLVRRHVIAWLALMVVLIGSLFLQSRIAHIATTAVAPSEGGTYSEGVLGQLNTLNPIFASTHPERSAARLLFSGLLSYDETGSLKNDLAESVTPLEGGKAYTVVLKRDIKWHDGAPITSKDVIFTVNAIKNVDVRSPLFSSWRDIDVKPVDERTVQFTLPTIYAPFPHLLTVGLIPEHKLASIEARDLRSSLFDRNPIGSGPFEFRSLQIINADQGRLVLNMTANTHFHQGRPNLERFQLHTYGERELLQRALRTGEVIAAADLTTQDIAQLPNKSDYRVIDAPLNNVTMAIMKTTDGILADVALRKALRVAIDRNEIIRKLDGHARMLDSPLPQTVSYSYPDAAQPAFSVAESEKLLDQAGWVKGADGKRTKGGQPLKLTVATVQTGDYPKILERISADLQRVGVGVETLIIDPSDAQQNLLSPRAYDILIYELAVGADPDVFPYWHSSQANVRGLNLANYSSGTADDALVSARGRIEPDLRQAKYRVFVADWLADAPGVVLYQPTLHYVTRTSVASVTEEGSLVDQVDRYRNILYWSPAITQDNLTP